MTSETKFVTAVYYSNFDNSRFVCIRIKQFNDGHFQLLDRNDYFQPEAILDEHAIWMNRKYKKPAKFLVLYDRREHNDGTNKCPYMVLKVGKNDLLEDMTIDHKAILVDGSFNVTRIEFVASAKFVRPSLLDCGEAWERYCYPQRGLRPVLLYKKTGSVRPWELGWVGSAL
ncbi:uncharacterized protein BJ212DRAFT_1295131 [Suillus subaureus]|uniref:Uncharacterized protein n=1 Tax=Suillus subaureus TaxID=48587 RepID=A0A9P7JJ87_9AGAM|nr:uncharacterized protein BJ212DRAFT_1295131 [Suillus subaureus]KAG1825762.1 hypothetical protein BJ212DRAFT_1295131 [Suillus subaureus]